MTAKKYNKMEAPGRAAGGVKGVQGGEAPLVN